MFTRHFRSGAFALTTATLLATAAHAERCKASWYGPGFHGNTMANGEPFNMNDPTTVAHKELRLGTRVRITNLNNGRSVDAVVRDRGPYIAGRCVDLSKAGANALGFIEAGTAPVEVTALE